MAGRRFDGSATDHHPHLVPPAAPLPAKADLVAANLTSTGNVTVDANTAVTVTIR